MDTIPLNVEEEQRRTVLVHKLTQGSDLNNYGFQVCQQGMGITPAPAEQPNSDNLVSLFEDIDEDEDAEENNKDENDNNNYDDDD
jgi:hypothetical protein